MRSSPDGRHRQTAFRVVAAQAAVTGASALVALATGGERAAYSALVGGGICVTTGAVLAARMFRAGTESSPAVALRAFFAGEVIKIALTVALFAGAIIYLEVDLLVVILAYMAALAVYLAALIMTAGGQH